ncbi:MAG: sulfatase, partial [Acidobacteriota bacterium]|nr:sulfatase [Acidobacteriota bacterium]
CNYEGLRNARFLFDLDQDPRELNDLAEIEPETTEALATRLQALRESFGEPPASEQPAADLDRKTLKALGYID